MTPPSLLVEISQLATDHKTWASRDFVFAQSLLWVGILASVTAGILAVLWNPTGLKGKTFKIIVASLPAFVITAEQSFKFCHRYQWHDEYYAELYALQNSLKYEKADEVAVSVKQSKVVKEMMAKFPSMTFQTIVPPGDQETKEERTPNSESSESQ